MSDAALASPGRDWIGVAAAAAFSVLFMVGMFLLVPFDPDQADAALIAEIDDAKATIVVGLYALVLSGLAFLVTAVTLVGRLGPALTERGLFVSRGTALLLSAALLFGPSVAGSPGAFVLFGPTDRRLDAGFARAITHAGFDMTFIAGALAAALFLATTSRAAQRSRLLPTWHVVIGYIAAVAMLAGALFIPMILLPVWGIATAVALSRGEPTRA